MVMGNNGRSEHFRSDSTPYLPSGHAIGRCPVTSKLDGRVFGEEFMNGIHSNFTHVYVYWAL